VTSAPLPAVPWQLTGNHWLALPCIHPANGAVHAIGALHRGARGSVEFAGGERFVDGAEPALARPVLTVDGVEVDLGGAGMAWERAIGWLPTFTCQAGRLLVRGTIFAPYGRDADSAGAVYAITIENRGPGDVDVGLALEGVLGHRQLRVRTPRPFEDAHRALLVDRDTVVLRGAAIPGLLALAIAADGDAEVTVDDGAQPRYRLRRQMRIAQGAHGEAAFYLAVGPEQDGAHAAINVMRRRGWKSLLAATRDALRALDQTTGHEAIDRLLNRNLLLAYFYAVGRALDDAHFYLVRTRAPWHGRGVTVREWEALAWTIPAVQLADAPLARELILRACELHGYAPGTGVRYLDGALYEAGFSLEGAASYALAVDRYIRETGDDQIVEEPVLADTLYLSADDIAARRDDRVPLYTTEVTPSGAPVPLPFTLHANAVAAQALEVLRRTLDEETAKEVEDPEATRAALRSHFARDPESKSVFASAVDLKGNTVDADEAEASALWLPLYEAVARDDSTYRRTVRAIGDDPTSLARQCARLLGPDAKRVLEWFRRAPLDGGLAAEQIDANGRATANGADASVAGILAYMLWYAVHALGVTP
jgi:hypothetical protein